MIRPNGSLSIKYVEKCCALILSCRKALRSNGKSVTVPLMFLRKESRTVITTPFCI